MTIGKFNFAPRTQTLYPDAGIQKKMRLTQESEIVTTGCHGRQKIATRAGLVVTKEVLPGAEERRGGRVTRSLLQPLSFHVLVVTIMNMLLGTIYPHYPKQH